MNSIRLGELAKRLGLELEGDPDLEISGVAALGDAGEDQLVFARAAAFAPQLAASRARAVVAPADLDVGARSVLRSADPSADFYRAARILVPEEHAPPGVHESATVEASARIDPSASIGPHCAIGADAVVGARSVLHAGVVLTDSVSIGEDCVLRARCVVASASVVGDRVELGPGVVVGGEGFGYVGGADGGLQKIHNVGRVRIGDDVEIGANSTIDRGTLGDTWIGDGCKIDNLVQIGHNCRLEAGCIVVAQAGIAGSAQLGKRVMVLAQSGITGHLKLHDGAVVGPQSGVHKDVPAGVRVFGTPQREAQAWHRESAALKRLPDLLRRVRKLERERKEES